MSTCDREGGHCGDGAFSAPDWVCRGCTPADQNFLTKDCAACKIRGCAIEKPVRGRPACHGYEACGALRDFVKGRSEFPLSTAGAILRQRMRTAAHDSEAAATQTT